MFDEKLTKIVSFSVKNNVEATSVHSAIDSNFRVCYLQYGGCVDFGNVPLQVLAKVVIGSVVVESDDSAAAVVVGECPCAVAFAQNPYTGR